MKKLICLFLVFTAFACNDGDFDVPAFEFTTTVNSCGSYLLYIKNSDSTEVLALSLTDTQIGTEEGTETVEISSSISATYRLFNDAIGTNYFCQTIPPFSPKVIKELNAEAGTISIITTAVLTDAVITGYTYEISISNFLIFDSNDERIFYESFDFGTFTRTL